MPQPTLEAVKACIQSEWALFETRYCEALSSTIPLLNAINTYQKEHAGKQLRPLLVMLSAGAMGCYNDKTLDLAVAVELLHNASLFHDDIVDNDALRRDAPSIHAKWGKHLAILVGDYYFALVIRYIQNAHNDAAGDILTQTVIEMTQGEMKQQEWLHGDRVPSKQNYMDIIYGKTASLMAACCEIGGGTVMRHFGDAFGIAFQLRDDYNDYDNDPITKILSRQDLAALKEQYLADALQALHDLPALSPSKNSDGTAPGSVSEQRMPADTCRQLLLHLTNLLFT